MPSIFIWKAHTSNPSKKVIRCYSGSNWVLEDNDYSSHSYKYLQQIVIPGSNNATVITFHVKFMPSDWIGSELLEVTHVPYHFIRSDDYGILEHIGNWMRFTTKQDILFTRESIQEEFKNIQQWLSAPPRSDPVMRSTAMVKDVSRPRHPTHHSAQHTLPKRVVPRVGSPAPIMPSISIASYVSPQQIQYDFQKFYQNCVTPVIN